MSNKINETRERLKAALQEALEREAERAVEDTHSDATASEDEMTRFAARLAAHQDSITDEPETHFGNGWSAWSAYGVRWLRATLDQGLKTLNETFARHSKSRRMRYRFVDTTGISDQDAAPQTHSSNSQAYPMRWVPTTFRKERTGKSVLYLKHRHGTVTRTPTVELFVDDVLVEPTSGVEDEEFLKLVFSSTVTSLNFFELRESDIDTERLVIHLRSRE